MRTVMKPPPPRPLIIGSATPVAKHIVTAASTAFPPSRSTRNPASATAACFAVTMPPLPRASVRVTIRRVVLRVACAGWVAVIASPPATPAGETGASLPFAAGGTRWARGGGRLPGPRARAGRAADHEHRAARHRQAGEERERHAGVGAVLHQQHALQPRPADAADRARRGEQARNGSCLMPELFGRHGEGERP